VVGRHNNRWHRYQDSGPGPVGDLLDEVADDPNGIFWG